MHEISSEPHVIARAQDRALTLAASRPAHQPQDAEQRQDDHLVADLDVGAEGENRQPYGGHGHAGHRVPESTAKPGP